MGEDGIGDWYNEYLQPIFFDIMAKIEEAVDAGEIDIVFYHIGVSFTKNTVALLEGLKGYLRSYPVAQGMRLLMEFEADADFLAKNPENIPRIKKKVDKCRADFIDEKKTWRETIIESGNMHLLYDLTKEDTTTKARVERVFDKDTYAFYCAYSHFNLYAICDDSENVQTLRDTRKSNCQKVALVEFYPTILDRFVETVNYVLKDKRISYDSSVFKENYEKLLNALLNAKIRSQDV